MQYVNRKINTITRNDMIMAMRARSRETSLMEELKNLKKKKKL